MMQIIMVAYFMWMTKRKWGGKLACGDWGDTVEPFLPVESESIL